MSTRLAVGLALIGVGFWLTRKRAPREPTFDVEIGDAEILSRPVQVGEPEIVPRAPSGEHGGGRLPPGSLDSGGSGKVVIGFDDAGYPIFGSPSESSYPFYG